MRSGKFWRNVPSDDMGHISTYKSKVLSNVKRNTMAKNPHQDERISLRGGDK